MKRHIDEDHWLLLVFVIFLFCVIFVLLPHVVGCGDSAQHKVQACSPGSHSMVLVETTYDDCPFGPLREDGTASVQVEECSEKHVVVDKQGSGEATGCTVHAEVHWLADQNPFDATLSEVWTCPDFFCSRSFVFQLERQ